MSCHCSDCGKKDNSSEFGFLYRDLKGNSVFTGFIQSYANASNIIWIGKDEKSHQPIVSQEDMQFFMTEMSQYDR